MKFLNEDIHFKMRTIEREQIKAIVRNNPEIYENESHYYRVAALRHMRTHADWEKEVKNV